MQAHPAIGDLSHAANACAGWHRGYTAGVTVDPTAATAAEAGSDHTAAQSGRDGRTPAGAGRGEGGLTAGEMLGKYRLERVLGEGGMGIVWAAFDPDLERAVAIKLLRPGQSEPTLRARLLREARAMARLKHANVLTVYEVGTVQNRDYIAMELVDGDNLVAWLETRPPRDQVTEALLAAGRGLAAAHAAGLVHRDFKPHNVLRSRDGHVYVTDFGLARGEIEPGAEVLPFAVTALPEQLSSPPPRPLDSLLHSPLTQTGVLIGTPAYMAPEQFAGRSPDARTDQFAFCVTAWEALTGSRPFRGSSLDELAAAAHHGVSRAEGDLPPALRAVLARGLDPQPDARWPSMPALLEALAAALAPPAVPAAAPERVPAPRNWPTAIANIVSHSLWPYSRPRGRRWRRLIIGGSIAAGAAIVAFLAVSSGEEDECSASDSAFDSAWSPDRRAAVLLAHPEPEMIGGAAILDEIRGGWLATYRSTCAAQNSPERRARLTCLREVKDAVGRTTRNLARPGSRLSFNEIVQLATSMRMCEDGRTREWIRSRSRDRSRDRDGPRYRGRSGDRDERPRDRGPSRNRGPSGDRSAPGDWSKYGKEMGKYGEEMGKWGEEMGKWGEDLGKQVGESVEKQLEGMFSPQSETPPPAPPSPPEPPSPSPSDQAVSPPEAPSPPEPPSPH